MLIPTILILAILQIGPTIKGQLFTSDRLVLAKNSRFRPLVAKTYDQLVYVSFLGYPEPKIKLEPEKIGYEPCEIGFPTIDDTERTISVDSLANGKVIVSVLGAKNSIDRYLLTLIVDLGTCRSNSVMTAVNMTTAVARDHAIYVLAGENLFDVFLTSYLECGAGKACRLRYNEVGELMEVNELELPVNSIAWSVEPVLEKDFSRGYFYTVFTDNYASVKRLYQDLKVQNEKLLDKTFLFSDTFSSINRCRGISNYELKCELFDENFETRTTVAIDTQPYDKYLRNITLFNLADGSALVLVVLQVYSDSENGTGISSYIHRVDLYGRVSRLAKFQDDLCRDFNDVKMSRMRDNFYCVSVSCRDTVRVKCVVYPAGI